MAGKLRVERESVGMTFHYSLHIIAITGLVNYVSVLWSLKKERAKSGSPWGFEKSPFVSGEMRTVGPTGTMPGILHSESTEHIGDR